ncbi:PPE domain-containing protein [Saccharopolyspora mangrovi]|uniref:PPE domain-containing protein n=1 Tax=Saccharopolyspora mangrovi TaxID=3082379 RepID=A0ABU6A9F0_9PSEU|nr:PPE domain-containing protein [Saccharopolyspora sp. S2-29]MEB3368024.1 PPE domain-containing protein [Saccharopolyspora sp. S2-29]
MPQESPDLALVETQNWASRSHRELYDAVHIANDPGRVGQLAEEWTKLGREMAEAADRMSEQLRATEAGWQGEAADAARKAIQKLADWSRDSGESAGALADRVAEQGRIMETAKAEMPEPVKGAENLHARAATTFASGDLESFAKAMDDLHANQERSSSAHEQAVRVMTRMEESSRDVDGDTPRFTPPPDPVEELKPRETVRTAPAGETAGNPPGGGTTQAQSAAAGAEATQKMTRPASAPVGQQPSAPPLAAQTGPAGAGPDVAPLAAQTGPAGANAPTKKMQVPKLTGPSSADSPTVRANPVKPASSGPAQKPPSLEDHKPNSTTAQGANPLHGGDGQQEKTRKMRPVQGPDGGSYGPGAGRPGGPNNRGGNRNWGGKIPPIPNTSGPGGDVPPIGRTNAAGGGSSSGAGAVPPMPPSGGAAGGSIAPGGSTGTGAPSGDHGGSGQAPGSGAAASGQSAMGGAGGMMGGGAMGNRGGQGSQDDERKAKYVEGGPVVEVPGKDLPPPVIGEGKKGKKNQG